MPFERSGLERREAVGAGRFNSIGPRPKLVARRLWPGNAVHPPFIAKALEKSMFTRVFFAVSVVLLALASPALAQGRHALPFGYNVQPLDRILPGIRSGRPGRFYDAEGPFADAVGGWHYRIKWLTPEGRIVWLDADARTGRVFGPYRGYGAGLMMPPSGLRYFRFPGGPRGGFRGRFGGWAPGGRWRGR